MELKRIAGLAAGIALAAGALVAVTPGAAQAASTCNTSRQISESGGRYYVLPAYGTIITCVMEKGVQGNEVRALQRTLNACYGQSLAVDGDFGDLTRTALRYAQGRAGITVDGVYGPETRDHIMWVRYNTGVPTTVCLTR